MKDFVDYLSQLRDLGSSPIAKLYKLCMPFLNLATGMLESPETSSNPLNETISATVAATGHSSNTIPGTSTFQAVLQPVPRVSVPDQVPVIDNSVLQDSTLPQGFPTFTSGTPDDVFWHLLDAQPRLQWLDSDFSGFQQAWGDAGFGDQRYMV
jgi:hypothetical protein